MKVKQVFMASPDEVRTVANQNEYPDKVRHKWNMLESYTLADWQTFKIYLDNGEQFIADLMEYGQFWILVATDHDIRLVNKAKILYITQCDTSS